MSGLVYHILTYGTAPAMRMTYAWLTCMHMVSHAQAHMEATLSAHAQVERALHAELAARQRANELLSEQAAAGREATAELDEAMAVGAATACSIQCCCAPLVMFQSYYHTCL